MIQQQTVQRTWLKKEIKVEIEKPKVVIKFQMILVSLSLSTDIDTRHSQLTQHFLNKFIEINQIDHPLPDQQSTLLLIKEISNNITIPNQSHLKDQEVSLKVKKDQNGEIIVTMVDLHKQVHPLLTSGHFQCHQQDYNVEGFYLDNALGCGSFSYLPQESLIEKGMSPVYMKWSEVKKKKEYGSLLEGNSVTKNGELKCTDQVVLKKQSGVLVDVLKKVTQSIMEGRGIVGVSLPVRIFQPISTIERIVDWWTYCPLYLPKAAEYHKQSLMVQRLIQVVAFGFSGLHVSVSQEKPFNPLLGETYQGTFEQDGTRIDCEHISHHPPITNFLLTNEEFKFYGSYEYQAQVSKTFNSINFQQKGESQVEFRDGSCIKWSLPFIKLSGVLTGDRTIKPYQQTQGSDQNRRYHYHPWMNLFINQFIDNSKKEGGFMGFGGSQRSDVIKGKIYKYDCKYKRKRCGDQKSQNVEDWKMEDMVEEIEEIRGSWLENLVVGEKEVWNIGRDRPSVHSPVENPLMSDPRFREDLIWLTYQNQKQSETWKILLEERQRYERKLRTAGSSTK